MPITQLPDGTYDVRPGDLVRVGRVQCIVRGVEVGPNVCMVYVRLTAQDEPDWIDAGKVTLIRRVERLRPDGGLAAPCHPEPGEE